MSCSKCGAPAVSHAGEFPAGTLTIADPVGPAYCEQCFVALTGAFCDRHSRCDPRPNRRRPVRRGNRTELRCLRCNTTLCFQELVPLIEGAGEQRRVVGWDGGLEYLRLPQWRTAFETADVILGVDVLTNREILIFGRDALQLVAISGMTDWPRVLRISIDGDSGELEMLVAACEALRGHQDYEAVDES